MNGTAELGWIDSHARISAAVGRMAAMRDAVGPDMGIGVDFHSRVYRSMAKTLIRELEPLKPVFIEEPVLSENAAATTIPIAPGERLYSRWDFKPILAAGHVDIIQPDPSHAGGITETRKIAAMAEAHDVALARMPQRRDPGVVARDPLQPGQRLAGLSNEARGVPLQGRLREHS